MKTQTGIRKMLANRFYILLVGVIYIIGVVMQINIYVCVGSEE